jgi:hypothetical protein
MEQLPYAVNGLADKRPYAVEEIAQHQINLEMNLLSELNNAPSHSPSVSPVTLTTWAACAGDVMMKNSTNRIKSTHRTFRRVMPQLYERYAPGGWIQADHH